MGRVRVVSAILQQYNGHLVPPPLLLINTNILQHIIVQLVFLHPSKAFIAEELHGPSSSSFNEICDQA